MPDDTKTNDDVKNDDVVDDVNDDTTSDDTSKDDDVDVLSEKEKKAIKESRKYQNRAQKAEKELEKIREEKLSADEKKDLKIKQLTDDKIESDRKLRESSVDSTIMGYANTLGFKDMDVVKLLVKQELVQDEEVSETDIKGIIDVIAKDKDYLIGSGDTTIVGAGNFEGGRKVEKEESVDELFAKELKDKANF